MCQWVKCREDDKSFRKVDQGQKHILRPLLLNGVETSGLAQDIANLNPHHLHMSDLTLTSESALCHYKVNFCFSRKVIRY